MSENLPNPPQSLPPIEFVAGGPTDEIQQANLEAVEPSPGYPPMVIMIADAITKRSDVVLLDYQQDMANVRYKVDGIWHSMPPMDRESGDFLLATLKRLANLDFEERVARQESDFVAIYLKHKHKCKIICQGVKTGERVAIYIDREKPSTDSLSDMGLRESQRQKLVKIINTEGTLVLAGYIPDEFSKAFWAGVQKAGDRFMQDYVILHDVQKPFEEVINVTPAPYDSKKGESVSSILPGVLLKEPNVLALNELSDGETLDAITELTVQQKISALARIEARDVFDAILRVMVLQPKLDDFANSLSCVLVQRTARILCDYCRQQFEPSPQLLQQLGLPANRVASMFTHFAPRPEDLIDENGNPIELEPCPKCGGPGYFERTSLFELLVVDDELRKAIVGKGNRNELINAARNCDHVSIRDEGVVMVAKGITSLEELRRVLKQ